MPGFSLFEIAGASKGGRGLRGLSGLGLLTSYPGVIRFQEVANNVIKVAGYSAAPSRCAIRRSMAVRRDGRWGTNTQALFERLARWVYTDECYLDSGNKPNHTDTTAATVIGAGPTAMRGVLLGTSLGMSMTSAQVDEAQTAWQAWRDRSTSGGGGGGGGGGTDTDDDSLDPNEGVPDEKKKSEGLSTGAMVAIGIGVVGGLALIGWLVWGRKKRG